MLEVLEGISAKDGGIVAGVCAGLLLVLKGVLRVKSDLRGDTGEVSAAHGFQLTIDTLTKQAQRQEAVIANLSDRLQKLDDRLTVEQEARRTAVHEMLDAQQEAMGLQHRLDAAEKLAESSKITADALRERVLVLEREVRELRPANGSRSGV